MDSKRLKDVILEFYLYTYLFFFYYYFFFFTFIFNISSLKDFADTDYPSRAPEFTPRILVGFVLLIFLCFCLCCPIKCLDVLSSVLWCPLRFPHKPRLNLQLFVGCLVPYLHYFCLLAYSGVQHILCCILFCFSSSCFLWTQCWQFLLIAPSVSRTFIYVYTNLSALCIPNYRGYVPFVIITIPSLLHSWLITRFVTWTNTTGATSGAGTLHPSKAQEINPGLVFGRSLFVLLSFLFRPLHCLFSLGHYIVCSL